MKQLIKYIRFDQKKLILIPTKDGLDFFGANKFSLNSDKGHPIPFDTSEDACGESNKLLALTATLPNDILFLHLEENVMMNEYRVRVYIGSQVNYYLKLPLSIDAPKPKPGQAGHKSLAIT